MLVAELINVDCRKTLKKLNVNKVDKCFWFAAMKFNETGYKKQLVLSAMKNNNLVRLMRLGSEMSYNGHSGKKQNVWFLAVATQTR